MYLATAPRTIALEDDGDFVLSGWLLGIAHPPGYPLYTLLAWTASQIPFGSIAFRVHALSALLGALSAAMLWQIAWKLSASRLAAYTAALALGVSTTFWSQAIIAEVYSLNVLLFLIAWSAAFQTRHAPTTGRVLFLFISVGLGLSNHWPLFLLASPAILATLWPARMRIVGHWLPASVGLLAGLTPYLWLVLRSQAEPGWSFSGPIDSLTAFVDYVGRSNYAAVDQSPTATWRDKLSFAAFALRELVAQFTWAGLLLALIGAHWTGRRWPLELSIGLWLTVAGGTIFLALLLGFDYGAIGVALFRVYPLVPYAIASLWLGLGVARLDEVLGRKQAYLMTAASVLFILFLAGSSFSSSNRTDYTYGRDYAQAVLDSLPENAILFVDHDVPHGTIGYLHLGERRRPDVTLVSAQWLSIPSRLTVADALASGRPLYSTVRMTNHPPTGRSWLLFRLDTGATDRWELPEPQREFFGKLQQQTQNPDAWTRLHREALLAELTHFLAARPPDALQEREAATYLAATLESLPSVLEAALLIRRRAGAEGRDRVAALLLRAQELLEPETEKRNRALLLNLLAWVQELDDNRLAAIDAWRSSLQAFPSTENEAYSKLCEGNESTVDVCTDVAPDGPRRR